MIFKTTLTQKVKKKMLIFNNILDHGICTNLLKLIWHTVLKDFAKCWMATHVDIHICVRKIMHDIITNNLTTKITSDKNNENKLNINKGNLFILTAISHSYFFLFHLKKKI